MGFDNNVLIIGYGAVSKCFLPIFLKEIEVPLDRITILDFEDKSEQLKPFTDKGIKYFQKKITKENLDKVLKEHAGNDGLIIDLAWNIGANDIITWCHDNNCLYVNTSVEMWNPYENKTIFEKTLYYRQMQLKELKYKWGNNAVTAVVDHGANPGLISHFTKKGIIDIGEKLISDKNVSSEEQEKIKEYIEKRDFANLARILCIKVIHCSERDTQITNQPKQVNEFVNTWSIEGFREEGIAPAEMGWGTHEKNLPPLAHLPLTGPKNQIFLSKMGINTRVKSYIPELGAIEGMIVRHGEAFGISDRLTVWADGKPIYRPTVHYAYMPCHEALSSLDELRARNYELQPNLRIMTNEIISGKDILGALLMGHKYKSWWTGSILDIDEARRIAPGQNAATLQVAAGVISAIKWMIDNPKKGICLPDDLSHNYVLNIAKPYLGELHSKPYKWTPIESRKVFFPENPEHKLDDDTWQFCNFITLP